MAWFVYKEAFQETSYNKLIFPHRDFIICIVSSKFFIRVCHPHFFHPHFIIRIFPSAFYHPHFSIRHPPSAIRRHPVLTLQRPHFDIICDLLLNRRTATWNLSVNYFMESACVRDFHTSWWSIWNRTSERSERVRFLIQNQRVWKSRTKRFPCSNLFISYILRFLLFIQL